jgi:hypothetical protein
VGKGGFTQRHKVHEEGQELWEEGQMRVLVKAAELGKKGKSGFNQRHKVR